MLFLLLLCPASALLAGARCSRRRPLRAHTEGPLSLGPSLKLVFVGGKGGVGKTSISSAIALRYAAEGERTLIVSTDPAHSLGDALQLALGPTPAAVVDGLDAMEVDADLAMVTWRDAVRDFDVEVFASRYGPLGVEAVKALGVDEFVELLATPPPGIDELVALASVIQYAEADGYDKIVVDTAPTGHALRLLDLPSFADGFIDKLVSLRSKLGALAALGGVGQIAKDVDALAQKLDDLRLSIRAVRAALRDGERTEFVVVTIPTELASAESERLARSLKGDKSGGGVALRSIVLNRLVNDENFGPEQARRLAARQRATLADATSAAPLDSLQRTEVPLLAGAEVVGAPGLRYFGQSCFGESWEPLSEPCEDARLVVVGGKGGVGKTTTAAALALWLADSGLRVAIVSTDPAHSLGDALGVALEGGEVVDVGSAWGVSLDALEVDADQAALEAVELLKDSLGSTFDGGKGAGDMGAAVGELAEALETVPPGVDELVSLLKVLELLRSKDYDRVVVDTAPTGHTLRLLALPELLDDFAERSINARERVKRNPLLTGALNMAKRAVLGDTGGGGASDEDEDASDRLREFQDKAFALDAILHDQAKTEFVLVAAPTDLSMAESKRLKLSLDESGIAANRLVVNGLIADTDAALDSFVANTKLTQATSLTRVQKLAEELDLNLTCLPQFDSDVNGIYGLRALGNVLFST